MQLLKKTEPVPVDMAVVNRIVKQVEVDWPDVQNGTFTGDSFPSYEYSVIGADGNLLFRSAESAPATVHEAVQASDAVLDVTRDGTVCGKVLISTNYKKRLRDVWKQLTMVAFAVFLLLLIPAVFYVLFLNRLILIPFQKLKGFARHIALGNLDAPLPMDRNHVFGAFTESFDMMREQLKEYRQREAYAAQSKKELIASLDELGELQVNPVEESSRILENMIRQADFYGESDILPIPDCLLWIDKVRMEQVIGNIINNAYKYGGRGRLLTLKNG